MNMMQRRTEIILGILIVIVAVVSIVITQAVAEQPLTRHDLQQQITDLDSFATEVSFMLDQYAQDKLDFNYLKYQATQIHKDVDDFYAQLESKKVGESQQASVLGVEDLVFHLGLQLKFIESSQGDSIKLTQIQQTIEQLHQKITESEYHDA
jgi:hypothetical protein